jgi:hypothetical protein
MIKNKRTRVNSALLALLGSKSLVKLWWKSPNKGLKGKVPNALWKQGKHLLVMMYVLTYSHMEGS